MYADLGTHSAHCTADRGDLTVTVLGMVVEAPVAVQRQMLWLGCAENCGASEVAVLGSSSSWTWLLCPSVQRLGAAQCLVQLWIHVLHHPGWLLEEFYDFLRGWVSRLLTSFLRFGRHVVDKGSGMFLTGFAGLTPLSLCSHDCRQFADRCFSCSRVALGNLCIIFHEPPVFSSFSMFELIFWGPRALTVVSARGPVVPESPGVYSQVTRHRVFQFILM